MSAAALYRAFRQLTPLVLLVFAPARTSAQSATVHCTPEDPEIFARVIRRQDPMSSQRIGERMVAVGITFLGTPYMAKTLEVGAPERLVVNLREMDCTTFVEYVLVMSDMLQSGRKDWDAYLKGLERVRYRGGDCNGYASRLHYFTDWIQDNEQKGMLRDITRELGGIPVQKPIDFMGTHPELYPALAYEEPLDSIRQIESGLSARTYYVLPRDSVRSREHLILEGDIIALATRIQGLDVTHTGIAVRNPDGRIHLLHASTQGEVMISEQPLAAYLKRIEGNTGILIARPTESSY